MAKKTTQGRVVTAALLAAVCLMATACNEGPTVRPPDPMELQGRWQGMTLAEVASPTGRSVGVPSNVKGVVVTQVTQGGSSGAFWAGIRPGDVIVSVGGKAVATLTDLYSLTTGFHSAAPVAVQLLRRGQPLNATLTLTPGAPTAPGVPQRAL